MKYISILFFIMMSSIVFSQTKFNKIINCERDAMHLLVSVSALEDGYVLLAGTSNVDGYGSNRCSMIIKLDENGNMLYNNFICDSTESVYEGWYNQKIHISHDGNYKYVFYIEHKGVLICDFNRTLDILNKDILPFDTINQQFLSFSYIDDDLYIPNGIQGDTISDLFYHPVLWKIDSMNNIIWKKGLFNETLPFQVFDVKRSFDGNLLLMGRLQGKQWLLSKIDTTGNIQWHKTYGRTNWQNGLDVYIIPSPDSCYVMSGVYPVCYANRFHEETSDAACVRKIDEDGNLLWEKVIKNYIAGQGIASNESAYDLYVDGEGFIYVVGLGGNCEGYAGILLKLTPNGEIVYRRNYLPTGGHNGWMAYLNSVKPTPDGGLIMGGYTYSEIYGNDFNGYYQQPWLVKTDIDGLDGLCYTELPELYLDVFIPDTVCNLDTIDCVVNISGPSAPYKLEFSTGQTIENIYYPDVFVPREIGIDTVLTGERMYQYTETITEATLKDTDTAVENIIAKHYNIATPTHPGEQQLAITLTDFYGNTRTITKDLYVNPCHEVEVDEDENVVLSVYPNPARENIIVEGENIAEIEICNLLGEVVYEMQQCNGNNVISTDGMGAGSYFVRVRMEDGKVVTKKIVVM